MIVSRGTPTELFDFLSDPSRFAGLGRLESPRLRDRQDRFFMLGDNSPRSKDSRGWGTGRSDVGRDDRPQGLGGPPAVPDRQGVLRLLAARGAVLARDHPVRAGLPVPVPAVCRADEVDSLTVSGQFESLEP